MLEDILCATFNVNLKFFSARTVPLLLFFSILLSRSLALIREASQREELLSKVIADTLLKDSMRRVTTEMGDIGQSNLQSLGKPSAGHPACN